MKQCLPYVAEDTATLGAVVSAPVGLKVVK